MVATISAAFTGFGIVLTGIGLIYTAIQIKRSRKIARSEFLIHLYELMEQHNELHARLTGGGWPVGRKGPETREEWIKVGRLMGLFEYIQILVEDGVLDVDTVDRLYSYRILPLVNNELIYQRHLTKANNTWKGFKKLWESLREKEIYCELAGQVSQGNQRALKEQVAANTEPSHKETLAPEGEENHAKHNEQVES